MGLGISKSTFRQLAERYASFAGARIAVSLSRWVVLLHSAQTLPAVEFARIAAFLSAVDIALAFSNAGADSFIYARIGPAARRIPTLVRTAIVTRAVSGTAIFAIGLAGGMLVLDDWHLLPMLLLVPCGIAQSTTIALLQKDGRFLSMLAIVAATLAGCAAVAYITISSRPDAAAVAWLLVAADLIAAACGVAISARALARALRVRVASLPRSLRAVLSKLAQTAIVSALVIGYTRLDVLVVLPLFGQLAQAHYSAAFRLVEPGFVFFAIASTALLAELGTRARGQTLDVAEWAATISIPALTCLLSLAALLLGGAAYLLVEQLLGLDPPVALAGGILVAAFPFRITNNLTSALLQRLSDFRSVTRGTVANAAVTFAGAVVLGFQWQGIGVAMATILGEALNLVVQRRALRRMVRAGGTRIAAPTRGETP